MTLISGDRRLENATLDARVARASAGLLKLGVEPGDVVALFLRNDFAFLEASLACGLIGAYSTPLNWHSSQEEASYLFEDCGARVIVIHADLLPRVGRAIPKGCAVLVVETPPEIAAAYGLERSTLAAAPGDCDWYSWLEGFAPYDGPSAPSPGAIIYTSGTTGRPKGVRRPPPSPEQMELSRRVARRVFGLDGPGAEIVTVIPGPMYHSSPNGYATLATRMGATVILMPRFDPEDLLRLIERHRVTHVQMVPIMFHRLLGLSADVRRSYDVSSLKFVSHAAAPCPPPVKRAMLEWWGPIIYEFYGSTETGALTFSTPQDWLGRPGTVGRPIPEVDVAVLGEYGLPRAPSEPGEIAARARALPDFTYHGDAAVGSEADRSELIRSGDIGYLDEDGFLFLCDRAKDMIISGGVNIYPAEIEAHLSKMPGVADCAVFGIPDDEYGEAICAAVQPVSGAVVSDESVRAFLRQHVSGYKVPRRVEIHAELPREDSGKIFKRKLRDPFWQTFGRKI
jgi:long-chain acyl-CoA synthetase